MSEISAEQIKEEKAKGCLLNRNRETFSVRVITENGVLSCEQIERISEGAKRFGSGEVAQTVRMTLEIQGVVYENLEPLREFLLEGGLETGGTGAKVRPISCCKGTVCVFGKIDTQGIATELHKRYYKGYERVALPHKFKIAVGGCPNNCVKPNLNDVGIMGECSPEFEEDLCRGCKKCAIVEVCPLGAASVQEGKMVIDQARCVRCGRCVGKCYFHAIPKGRVGYRVYIGGRWGKETRHGDLLADSFSKEEALDMVEKVILLYKENGKKGERLAQMIDRIGLAKVEELLAHGALLERKAEILGEESSGISHKDF